MDEQIATAQSASSVMSRRRWVYAAVAAAAGLGGAGLAWWKYAPRDMAQGAEAALWDMNFERPAGGALAMQSFKGRPLLLNFWATWCPPCIEELPLLDRFFKENSANGWQVLGLAIDQPGAVRNFLRKMPLAFPIGLAGMAGAELGKSLGNLSGGLPFTVVLGSDGLVRHRRIGKVSPGDLLAWRDLI